MNRQLGDEVFHPSRLVNFRNRLEEHQQSALGFTQALEAAGTSVQPQTHQTPVPAVTSSADAPPEAQEPGVAAAVQVAPVAPPGTAATTGGGALTRQPGEDPTQTLATGSSATIQPKHKQQLASDHVQNPHEPEATYAVKGRGEHKKEHVGYKCEAGATAGGLEPPAGGEALGPSGGARKPLS